MRKVERVAALTVAAVLSAGAVASAADEVVRTHTNETETFADNICGIAGVTELRTNVVMRIFSDGSFKRTVQLRGVFTSDATGKSVQISQAGQESGPAPASQDGTTTYVTTYRGLPEKIKLPNGRVLSRDAGVVTVTDVVGTDAQGKPVLLSETVSGEKGPHPDLDSGFGDFCEVVSDALA